MFWTVEDAGPYAKGGSICKNSDVLFTFWSFYDIIISVICLIDKLEFDEGGMQ